MGAHSGISGEEEHYAAFNKPSVVVINPYVKIDVVNIIELNSDSRI
jgi:hypothetical protein